MSVDASESVLRKAEWQSVLFCEQPLRSELLKLVAAWKLRPVTLRVHRNHSFEHVESAMRPYAAFGDWFPNTIYSDYDDSLNFVVEGQADIELIWLDVERYELKMPPDEFENWIVGRVQQLRKLVNAPILIVMSGADSKCCTAVIVRMSGIADVRIGDTAPIASSLGPRFLDRRAALLSGTRLSNAATVRLARELACKWIPAALWPPIKAVAVDLDNTLYCGVLGEDGPESIVLTDAHVALQRRLVDLQRSGVFLALVSRNEIEDARKLFHLRTDFPLKWDDFAAHAVAWDDKAKGIAQIASALRIGVDAVLFIDDNPGELVAVAQSLPSVHTIHATNVSDLTLEALNYYPGIWRWGTTRDDRLRIDDLKASEEREALLASATDPQEYYSSLQIKLRYSVNAPEELPRLHDLCQKTNQFNLALRRLREAELASFMNAPDCSVVSIKLSDRLSDSGIIGIIAARVKNALIVEELCVSCRALGRNLENLMITQAVQLLLENLPADTVEFVCRVGPRNQPALAWLSRFANVEVTEEQQTVSLPSSKFSEVPTFSGITIDAGVSNGI